MSAVSADNVLVQPECAAAGSALGAPAPAASEVCCQSQHGYLTDKSRYLARAKRIEGQARGIGRMIDEDQYCIDILTQISAATSALQGLALALLDDHIRHCVVQAAQSDPNELTTKLDEATAAIARLVRT
ncbi:metal-sensitive transcriptional regulator [Gordonia defluvii]|jgi:DNA-binding FrmR family transcriptional regulator|uniref:Metal-sensitive transcriptional regulator n=1 Tax=Gordonia defluvii TaxID=283718 RepID=A0ABN3YEV1_9ACTN|nr:MULTISPECIES: metal-sensitive transcriptional regulator [Mycobacteriales]